MNLTSKKYFDNAVSITRKFASFVGPGIMVSVAYMDPGNYSTAVTAGANYEYKLLLIVSLSNIFAVVLQCLCIKLGTITGLDLAQFCRLVLPPYVNMGLYVCAELALIATDLAEVVGTAIALEIIFHIPLAYGVFITVADILMVLVAYNRDGYMKQTRIFELVVSALVFLTCTCFIAELFKCDFSPGSWKSIIKGYLPLDLSLFQEKNALFLTCGIVGSTVMPHSLFLGSALVQPRLKEFDIQQGHYQDNNEPEPQEDTQVNRKIWDKLRNLSNNADLKRKYKPSLEAINYCLRYCYAELIVSLFSIAVFVNSSILIVAGVTLYKKPDAENADLLSIYEMLTHYISSAAGMIFAVSMLFSGQSAGIVCTMAGQIVSEGFLKWSTKPWIRRLLTRCIAVLPVIAAILFMGREGVAKILNASQVVLSLLLPVLMAPLIWATCNRELMTVYGNGEVTNDTEQASLLRGHEEQRGTKKVVFKNGIFLTTVSIFTWVVITFLNIYLIWLYAHGIDV